MANLKQADYQKNNSETKDDHDNVYDIEFRNATKRYGDVVALDNSDLKIPKGSFHSLLGPSGCGKTTSLRLIAGFEKPTKGDILHKGTSIVATPPHKRPFNMVFQHYAPFPHLNVEDNISYGPRQRTPKMAKKDLRKLVGEMLELVRLPGFQKRQTWELSGGQLQRVVLARALINHPAVLLLDEPLAALDRKLRREMQMELQSLQREVGVTFVLVTHDQEEALSMSDTISIMRDGQIVQTGTPTELYDTPVDSYVADFVGESNFFSGRVTESDSVHATIQTKNEIKLTAPYPEGGCTLSTGQQGAVIVRPEVVQLWHKDSDVTPNVDFSIKGIIVNRIYLGHQAEFSIKTDALGEILARIPKTTEAQSHILSSGDKVFLGWKWDVGLAMPEG